MILSLLSSITSNPTITTLSDLSSTNPDLSFQAIALLTFEAVLEVVIICFAGFISAKTGLLNSSGQKVLSQLNVDLFTPCLVFIKLAPSLNFQKMIDIIIIPIFYAISTGISFICSKLVSKYFQLNEPESDFVTAMAVFGNSNSLPVSLTLSLAFTLPDLLWEDIDNDNNDQVASRGILYLLIFQQLGQILRWSWGFNKLLRKRSMEELNTYYNKDGTLQIITTRLQSSNSSNSSQDDDDERSAMLLEGDVVTRYTDDVENQSSSTTPIITVSDESEDDDSQPLTINSSNSSNPHPTSTPTEPKQFIIIQFFKSIYQSSIVQNFLKFMNPPLYAMIISIIVASIPFLQNIFFVDQDSFVHNTITNSITQLGSVSIPLILIVLGSNLYPQRDIPPASKHYKRIVFGSLLSRMILPSIILLPIIATCVKFLKISILDDPIFLIVAFILTISPPAIQLSQISQLNNIYQKEMAGVLFWGYVILTFPTTIFIVVTSLEVLKWAK
ncbi:auxin efflux carrier [Scheffersomyces coipomensis]|uniref:auxin efflux carrier n=1 Tax=Scheffersomyces coipomensis TaxID=1788519 RepID=UPI00315D60C0